MEIWHIWAALALIMVIIEIFTVGFFAICMAFGAAGAAIASAVTESLSWQIVVFAVVTLLSFLFVRPFINRAFNRKKDLPKSGVEALIGRTATVETRIDAAAGTGRVAVDGDSWKAVSGDGSVIEKGEKVVIEKIDSIILTVRKINS